MPRDVSKLDATQILVIAPGEEVPPPDPGKRMIFAGVDEKGNRIYLNPVIAVLLYEAAKALAESFAKRLGQNLADKLTEALFGNSGSSGFEEEVISRLNTIIALLEEIRKFLAQDLIRVVEAGVDISLAKQAASALHQRVEIGYVNTQELLQDALAAPHVDSSRVSSLSDQLYKDSTEIVESALTILANPSLAPAFYGVAIEAMSTVVNCASLLCGDRPGAYGRGLTRTAEKIRAAANSLLDKTVPKSFASAFAAIDARLAVSNILINGNANGGRDFLAGWMLHSHSGVGAGTIWKVRPQTFRLTNFQDFKPTVSQPNCQRTGTTRPSVDINSESRPSAVQVYDQIKKTPPNYDDFPIMPWWSPMEYGWSSFELEAQVAIGTEWYFGKVEGPPIHLELQRHIASLQSLILACDKVILACRP